MEFDCGCFLLISCEINCPELAAGPDRAAKLAQLQGWSAPSSAIFTVFMSSKTMTLYFLKFTGCFSSFYLVFFCLTLFLKH